ncbi:MAG: hypothetical protein WCS72_14305, partial [Deltaproteobacteria bacterium]
AGAPPAQYRGAAVADVPGGGTVNVAIPLQPLAPSGGTSNAAPVVDTLTIDAVSVPVAATVALSAAAHDPDAGDVLSYLWTVPPACGSFADSGRADTARPATLWQAPAGPATCRLTVRVSDGRGASVSVYADVVVGP